MENLFYIQIRNKDSFPLGTIFEMTDKRKIVSLDDKKHNQLNESILAFCESIDRKSVMLIQPILLSNRVKCFQDPSWIILSSLDVGDDCWYLMNNKEVFCKIISKYLTNKGIMFTIHLESGSKIETSIDRLKYKETMEPGVKKSEDEDVIPDRTKNLISTFEDMSHQKERNRRRETITFGMSKSVIPKCNCFKEIFNKADNLQMSSHEKQHFLTNLLRILPRELNADDGRNILHWASHYLLRDLIAEFISFEDIKNKRDIMGNTPLHLAMSSPLIDSTNIVMKKRFESILQLFLSNKVDINIPNTNKDTILTKIVKNADFNLFDLVLKFIEDPIILSNHLLADNTSILEFLIKIEKHYLAEIYCSNIAVNKKENQLLLQAAFHAVYRNYNNLSKKIIDKCSDINFILHDGETFLTRILKEKSITSGSICFQLDNSALDVNKQNTAKQYPLLLACGRFLLEPAKLILDKGNTPVLHLNECLNEVITIYTNFYISSNYKKTKTEFIKKTEDGESMGVQLKQVVFEIAELLIMRGATVDSSKELEQLLDECVDQELGKIVKHLCRQKSALCTKKPTLKILAEIKNECSICMERIIDCSFACGHTFCSNCADKLSQCPTCRVPMTGKRTIYI